jgi:hypothetical protein
MAPQRGTGTVVRQQIKLPPGSAGNTLLIYSGEVSCNFFSPSGTTVSDQLQIFIDASILDATKIVGPPFPPPLVLPTSWNSNGSNTVIAINEPVLFCGTSGEIPGGTLTGPNGLWIIATVSVQHGSLLNAQYQVSFLANLP